MTRRLRIATHDKWAILFSGCRTQMCLARGSQSLGCSLFEIGIAAGVSIVAVYLLMYLKAVSDAFFFGSFSV